MFFLMMSYMCMLFISMQGEVREVADVLIKCIWL